MNNYPIWWDTTITIFNKYQDTQTQLVKWYKHTIPNCFWKYIGNKVNVGEVVLQTNDTICRIPKDSNYKEKYEWINIPNDLMSQYFTLGAGDIIVKGAVDDTIDEYIKGKRSSDLLSKYKALQGCIEIQEVSDNTGVGRCDEHYLVRGV